MDKHQEWEMVIGYIGLGALGGALARRLLATHSLCVWDVNTAAVDAMQKLGAQRASTAAELARCSDVVLLCLPRSADVQQVTFGPHGLAEGLAERAVIIDQTSGDPAVTRTIGAKLSTRGIHMLDAPVSGSPSTVTAGNSTIMVSGPYDLFERVSPIFSAITSNVIHCGTRLGDAQAMKLVNNTMNAGCRLATLEVVAMGKKMGLSLEAMTDVVNKGSGRNSTSKTMLPALIEGRQSTQFALSLMLKDLNQGVALGMGCGAPMPIASVVRGLLQVGVNTLGESAQLEDVVGLIESMADARIKEPLQQGAAHGVQTAAPADPDALKVGYVGLGATGGALTRRLMLSRKMHVFDARGDLVRTFEAEGALGAADLPSLARACDVIMICVPTSAIVRQVVFGPGGLAEGLDAGKIVVDQTTGDPSETRRIAADLAKLGVQLVDAPVSGGPRGAVAGTIAIMCGGAPQTFANVRPILESISPNIVYCGETGNGHVAKLINNAVASCNRLITYETVAVGFKYGLSIEDMAKVVNRSSGWNGASERILPVLAAGGQTANFRLQLMVKDLKLAAQMAIDCGAPLFIANTVRNLFEVGAHRLGGEENLDAMARLFEEMAAVEFSKSPAVDQVA
ncbi:NAD(P)-dependent oxidoreductase [uncultured Paraburkholderia sp.]|uniref:NAD(P)-dependent oxidoreductase n=1 Tax=uncultured Paraburkholderia sp. TaxID=1822466 RepID=UPI0025994350|nr:NAD(P)-dependent oxidoreductase [uncultured Paraburkholderia sp.]